MKANTATLLAFLTSFALAGCMHRAPSLKMLETRAEYEVGAPESVELQLKSGALLGSDGAVPVQTKPKIAHVWIHKHETPDSAYFWGGWITVTIEGPSWSFKRPQTGESAPTEIAQ